MFELANTHLPVLGGLLDQTDCFVSGLTLYRNLRGIKSDER
jgi:hypothetical protein